MIPFLDLKAQFERIQEEIQAAVRASFASTEFTLGKEVAAFEEEFAAYCGGKYGYGIGSIPVPAHCT